MDTELQKASTSSAVPKPPKNQPDSGNSNCGKSRQKEIRDANKPHKMRKPRQMQPKVQPQVVMRSNNDLHQSLKMLQSRTKNVRAKLIRMKSTTKPKTQEPTEEDILRRIEELQEQLQKVRLKKSTEPDEKGGSKPDPAVADGSEDKAEEKPRRVRVRTKNVRKPSERSEEDLQVLYVKHINRIVGEAGDSDDSKPSNPDLVFKQGDDLEVFAQKCEAAGLGRIIEAEVRVNAKNNHQAFITMTDGPDAMIASMAARKYAMEGDIVRAFIRDTKTPPAQAVGEDAIAVLGAIEEPLVEPENGLVTDVEVLRNTQAIDTALTRQAFVIRLVKEIGNRVFVGSVAFKNPSRFDSHDFFKFKPRDTKVPMIYIPVESCGEVLSQLKSDDAVGFLYLAEITKIMENGRCIGRLQSPVGKCGNLEDEIKAILLHNGLKDVQPFEERFNEMWTEPLAVTEADIKAREDLRKECIFTIDPLTARDLDDAVSCKTLADGSYEIGVHISDVASFLEESCELDELVKLRATSIYLVNEVVHMLPKTLCMKCSLLPDEDKFAFSVFWVMDAEANIKSTRFTRSIIRSCTQLAYEHAQKIIDNPSEPLTVDDLPTICNGFAVTDIVERVLKLNSLAEIMRKKRFENGSLSIDKPQFYFQFDPKTGEPTSYEIAARLSANFLIEEFMLLANQSVAQFIYKRFPEISFLRSHLPPKPSAVRNLLAKLSAVGIDLDMSSSKSIFDGLKKICGASSRPEVLAVGMNYLLTKPMMRAKYFCSDIVDSEADLYHYALAIPIYTHFTSPIRRYPDIIVHRLLSAALDYTPPPKRTTDELHILAKICNDQKFNAKNAGEECANLYFQRYVKAKKSIQVKAVITDIYRHSLEVITLDTGHLITVPFKLQKVLIDASKAPMYVCISEKNSTRAPQTLKMFYPVDIKLTMWEGKLIGFFISPDQEQRIKNNISESNDRETGEEAPLPRPARRRRHAKRISRSSQSETAKTDA